LIASYHGIHDVNDFNYDRAHLMTLYERAALRIEKGGMALSNVAFISLPVFACSLAASMRELAKAFPEWIEIDDGGALVSVSHKKAPDIAAQVVNFANQWWSKCISMVIAETASRNVAFKAARLSDSIFDRQSEILRTEAATVDSPSQEDDFDDVGSNAELYLYASRQDTF